MKVENTRRRSAYLQLIVADVVFTCVLTILVAETVVRIAGLGSDQLLRPDQTLGVRFIASKGGISQGACFDATVSVNSHGWRSPEVSLAKPDGVYRVLVLGDSFMAAVQVQDNETFARVLERELNRGGENQRVQVINMSVPSWGTDQEYLALRQYGMSYDPDLVVLAFYAMNDVSDNSAIFVPDPARDLKPFFDVVDGELVELPFESPYPRPLVLGFGLAAQFRLYPIVRDRLLRSDVMRRWLYALGLVAMPPAIARPAELRASTWGWPVRWRAQSEVYRRQDSDRWQHAWTITEQLVARARDDVQRAGARFLLVDIGAPIALMPQSILAGLDRGGADLDIDKPARLLQEIAARNGIDFLSLVPYFKSHIGESAAAFGDYFLSCDGHWTPAGHRLAAETVARDIGAPTTRHSSLRGPRARFLRNDSDEYRSASTVAASNAP